MATLATAAQATWLPTQMMISGRLQPGAGAPVTVRNPSSGETTAEFAGSSIEQVRAAIAAARAVADQGAWAAIPMKVRVEIVRDLLARFTARIDDLRDLPDNKNPAAQDEIFGPVVSVIGYRDVEHAIEMANDLPLGPSGYVHGKDARQALEVARRIRTGTININAFFASASSSSGGHKMSGIGRERGVEGIRAFQDVQVMNLGSAS